ncbi:MAG TPA: DnaJ domain-containing protein [Methylomirabilota bacterium]|nr:DnaJ domain-containing protein [Methylomirabilota bacterium]
MSIEPDPYRVLGLARGATADEVRRAYRRLVKENHPDSAGEKALPRFLAIQAAYETLAGGPSIRRVGGRAAATRPVPRDPWRADPDRARTTRDTSARPGRAGRPASAGGPTAKGSSGGPSTKGSTGTPGGSTGRGGDGVGSSQRPAGDRPRPDGRKRAPNKATLGSTSYDAAADEPFEPEWSGGTWYGASSGTYWTLNPKEYADPRKHGPEYQRRARRRTAGTGVGGAGQRPDEPWDDDLGEPVEPPIGGPSGADGPSADEESAARGAAGRPAVGRRRSEGRGTRSAGSTPAWDAASAAWDHAAPSAGSSAESDGLDPFAAAAHVATSLAGTPRGFMARVGLALIGWPAIGLALTTVTGELTGCGRFAANCVDPFGVGTWLAQLVIIAILLILPSVAALSAVGSLVALAAAVPTAVILSASGGSHEPAASATILGVVLVLAYAAGVFVALVRRRGIAPLP